MRFYYKPSAGSTVIGMFRFLNSCIRFLNPSLEKGLVIIVMPFWFLYFRATYNNGVDEVAQPIGMGGIRTLPLRVAGRNILRYALITSPNPLSINSLECSSKYFNLAIITESISLKLIWNFTIFGSKRGLVVGIINLAISRSLFISIF